MLNQYETSPKALFNWFILVFFCTAWSCSNNSSSSQKPPYSFSPFEFLAAAPDPNEFLCAQANAPDTAEDKIFIDCLLEGESYVQSPTPPKDEIKIVAYNVERGYKVAQQLVELKKLQADIILLSEVDRGCSRTGGAALAQTYAKELQMNYVYAVEFVELTKQSDGSRKAQCEHGNAILSRYPIGNVEQIRHAAQESWFDAGQSRLGGRIAIAADIQIGEQYVRVYSVHFESNIPEEPRNAQAREIAEHGLRSPLLVVVGGDFNSGYLGLELQWGAEVDETARQFTTLGYHDAHADLSFESRITAPSSEFILDLLMSHPGKLSNPGVGSRELWDGLSDHRPVWATLTLP